MSLLLDEIALAAARLAEAGVESPRAEAELIAAHVHGVRRTELHEVPDAAFDARFWEGVGRRAAREPLQHITGRAYFRYLELEVMALNLDASAANATAPVSSMRGFNFSMSRAARPSLTPRLVSNRAREPLIPAPAPTIRPTL